MLAGSPLLSDSFALQRCLMSEMIFSLRPDSAFALKAGGLDGNPPFPKVASHCRTKSIVFFAHGVELFARVRRISNSFNYFIGGPLWYRFAHHDAIGQSRCFDSFTPTSESALCGLG